MDSLARARAVLEDAVTDEVRRSLQQLSNTAEVAEINVSVLETSLRRLEGLILQRSNEQIRLNQLQRIADANNRVYEEFLGRFKESSEIQNLQSSDAEVITYASPPGAPSFPNKKVSVALAGVGGLFAGLALAFLLEFRRKPIKTAREVTQLTGFSVFRPRPSAQPKSIPPASVS